MIKHEKSGLWMREGTFDASVIVECKQYLAAKPTRDDLLLDVGGNIGATAALFAREHCRVVTIEPDPDNFRVLQANIEPYPHVSAIEGAVTMAYEKRELYLNGGVNKGAHSLVIKQGRKEKVEVACYPLPDLISAYAPTILKIDIEGGEYELAPGLASLPDHVRCVMMEFHFSKRVWRAELAPALVASIDAQGFRRIREPKVEGRAWATVGFWVR